MSTWVIMTPRKPRPRRPYAHTADHIRGRVFRMDHKTTVGDWMWGMEVVNNNTGQVIASDNCSRRESLLAVCEEATAAARATWFWSYSPKKVRP